MKYKIIVCVNNNFAIGKDNELLYHIRQDMCNLRTMTTGNVVIMGRKTFESLPNKKPLKNRVNIIVTTDKEYGVPAEYDNVYITNSIKEVDELCEAYFSDKDLFVLGGASIYSQFLDEELVDTIYLTKVNEIKDGDVFLSLKANNTKDWSVYFQTDEQFDKENNLRYTFTVLKKKN